MDVTGVQKFPFISPRENNWKLLDTCVVIPCNTMNYLIRRQSERYTIIVIINSNTITNKTEFER